MSKELVELKALQSIFAQELLEIEQIESAINAIEETNKYGLSGRFKMVTPPLSDEYTDFNIISRLSENEYNEIKAIILNSLNSSRSTILTSIKRRIKNDWTIFHVTTFANVRVHMDDWLHDRSRAVKKTGAL